MNGSVIVPAHNEQAVIAGTLSQLQSLTLEGIEVIVSANGCTDETADVARGFAGITVVEVEQASKAAALNAADNVATHWPRLYLDADILITKAAVKHVFSALQTQTVLAARPKRTYDLVGADPWVARYYRARERMAAMDEHLWGAGSYGLSRAGHARLVRFPDLIADDLYVDALFDRSEILVVDTDPVVVRCPRTWKALVSTLSRVQKGKRQLIARQAIVKVGGLGALARTVYDMQSLVDAVAYAGLSALSRLATRRSKVVWQRDETTRSTDLHQPSQRRLN